MLKLVRLARMPRLLKLLDPERFTKVVKSFENDNSDINDVVARDGILFLYNMVRLCIIAILLTYGFGCMIYFYSSEFNTEQSVKDGETFVLANGLHAPRTDAENLIVVWYFALTTLSTVGYGDYSSVSQGEMIMSVVM